MGDLLKTIKAFSAENSAWVNTILFITSLYIGAQYVQVSILVPLQASMYSIYTKDAYKSTQYELSAFIYTETGNQDKLHETALSKYSYFCGGYFGKTFVPSLDADEEMSMKAACEFVEELQKDLLLKGIKK